MCKTEYDPNKIKKEQNKLTENIRRRLGENIPLTNISYIPEFELFLSMQPMLCAKIDWQSGFKEKKINGHEGFLS